MDKQSLLNKISFILQDLKTQHLKLTGNVDRIPEIDLDLFLANANFLVNHLEVLKKINGSSPDVRERDDILKNLFNAKELERLLETPQELISEENKEESHSSPIEENPHGSRNLIEEENQDMGIHNNSPKTNLEYTPENPPVKSRNESFIETQNNFVVPFTNKQGVFAPELERKAAYFADKNEVPEERLKEFQNSLNGKFKNPDIQESPVPGSLNESFNQELKALRDLNYQLEEGQKQAPSHPNPSPNEPFQGNSKAPLPGTEGHPKNVHEFMGNQKREPSLLNKLGNLPVKDIRKAIGLNEHLLFIKTLFQGDPAIYDRTLTMIDSFNSSEQAFQFLQNEIAGPFNWEGKKAVAELFKNIVNRKFAGGR